MEIIVTTGLSIIRKLNPPTDIHPRLLKSTPTDSLPY
jgi:hypothetical protein